MFNPTVKTTLRQGETGREKEKKGGGKMIAETKGKLGLFTVI